MEAALVAWLLKKLQIFPNKKELKRKRKTSPNGSMVFKTHGLLVVGRALVGSAGEGHGLTPESLSDGGSSLLLETFETSIVSMELYSAPSAIYEAFKGFSGLFRNLSGQERRVPDARPHLFGRVRLTENCVDVLGFGEHLGLRVDGFEFFAGQPELDVLLAELFPEELREDLHPV